MSLHTIPYQTSDISLETDRLRLRQPDNRDTDAVVAFYGTDRSRHVGGPKPADQAWRAMAMFCGQWTLRGYGLFTVEIKKTGRAIGLIGPYYPHGWPETELGWHLWDAADEGQGFAYEAAMETRNYARVVLGWDQIVSYIDAPNTASIALAERMGAVHDPAARAPDVGKDTVLVYRHPAKEAA